MKVVRCRAAKCAGHVAVEEYVDARRGVCRTTAQAVGLTSAMRIAHGGVGIDSRSHAENTRRSRWRVCHQAMPSASLPTRGG